MPLIMTGDELEKQVGGNRVLKPREIISDAMNYLKSGEEQQVHILYGLRRTGKSVMLDHLIDSIGNFDQTAYIYPREDENFDSVVDPIRDMIHNRGFKYFFIDEATNIEHFIGNAGIFSDIIARNGVKVVLTGTDSLGFNLASLNSLYARHDMTHTTWISYSEHANLLGTNDIDDYIESGGILPKNRKEYFKSYSLAAIVPNILRSLRNFRSDGSFGSLKPLYEDGILETAINNVIKHESHKFTAEILKKQFDLSDYFMGKRNVSNDEARKFFGNIDEKRLLQDVREYLGIKDLGTVKFSAIQLHDLNKYFVDLDLARPRIVLNPEHIYPKATPETLKLLISPTEYYIANGYNSWLLTQPGMRWAQVQAILNSLREQLEKESCTKLNKNKLFVDIVFESIENNARGHILEEIVTFELQQKFGNNYHIFQYKKSDRDVDIVVAGRRREGVWLYEVKNNTGTDSKYGRHIRSDEVAEHLRPCFGEIRGRSIIYRGEDAVSDGCEYHNCGNFLKSAAGAKTPDDLMFEPGKKRQAQAKRARL